MPKEKIKVDVSILDYFKMMLDFDNESEEYQRETEDEFERNLKIALNAKEIVWIKREK